jgi:ABC-type branched-subunit amino acid transport system ATPase component
MMKVTNLSAGYGRFPVLRGINLEIPAGDCRVVIGPNGAGKTTLLRSMFGLLSPKDGNVTYNGSDIQGLKPRTLIERGIAYVPQQPTVFPELTVDANLYMGAFYSADRDSMVSGVYEKFPLLAKHRRTLARALSGGERRLLEIGRALMVGPKLLMLDEPSLGLSPVMMDRVLEEIVNINTNEVTVVLVEQRLRAALSVAKSVSVVRLGRLAKTGSSEEAADPDWLADALYDSEA